MRRHRGSSGGAACLAYRGAAAAPRAGPLCGEHDSEPGRPGRPGPCARHRARRRRRPRRVLWPPIRVWRRSPRSGKRARPVRPAGSVGQSGPGDWPARWTGPADAGGSRVRSAAAGNRRTGGDIGFFFRSFYSIFILQWQQWQAVCAQPARCAPCCLRVEGGCRSLTWSRSGKTLRDWPTERRISVLDSCRYQCGYCRQQK